MGSKGTVSSITANSAPFSLCSYDKPCSPSPGQAEMQSCRGDPWVHRGEWGKPRAAEPSPRVVTEDRSSHTHTLLATKSLESRHHLQLLPRREISCNPPLWPSSEAGRARATPFAHPSRPCSPQCCQLRWPKQFPTLPKKPGQKVQEKERNEFFHEGCKASAKPKATQAAALGAHIHRPSCALSGV